MRDRLPYAIVNELVSLFLIPRLLTLLNVEALNSILYEFLIKIKKGLLFLLTQFRLFHANKVLGSEYRCGAKMIV